MAESTTTTTQTDRALVVHPSHGKPYPSLKHSIEERANAKLSLLNMQEQLRVLRVQKKWSGEADVIRYNKLKHSINYLQTKFIYKIWDKDQAENG